MKKLSLLLTIFVLFTLLVTACAPATTEVVEETEVEEPVVEETEAEEPVVEETEVEEPVVEATEEEMMTLDVTVDFWHVYSDAPGEAMQGLVDRFNAENEYGITVAAYDQGNYGDVEDKFNAGIQSGDLPDIVLAYTNTLADWYSVDSIIDLNPYIQDADYGLTEDELADIYPHLKAGGTTPDGAWIAYPMTQSANVMVYNYTWAQELGFDAAPTTTAELEEQLCAAAAANNELGADFEGTGGLVFSPSMSNWMNFVFAYGGDVLNDDMSAYEFDSAEAVAASMYIIGLKEKGCAWQAENWYPNPEQAQRKALITMSSTAGLHYYDAAFADEENDDVWGFFATPGPDGNLAVDAFKQTIGVVPSTYEEELASWLFIKWLTSPEIQAEWVKGQKGYYGTQYSTEGLLEDFAAENPIWAEGVALAALGPSEPENAPAWSSVRSAVGDTVAELWNATDEAQVVTILENLTQTAADLIEEVQ